MYNKVFMINILSLYTVSYCVCQSQILYFYLKVLKIIAQLEGHIQINHFSKLNFLYYLKF